MTLVVLLVLTSSAVTGLEIIDLSSAEVKAWHDLSLFPANGVQYSDALAMIGSNWNSIRVVERWNNHPGISPSPNAPDCAVRLSLSEPADGASRLQLQDREIVLY